MRQRIQQIVLTLIGGLGLIAVLILPANRPAILAEAGASAASVSLTFVDKTGAPLVNERIHVFCYTPGGLFIAEIIVLTGADGRPTPDLPPDCALIAAFQWRYEQPSGKPGHGPAYTVYYTSWSPRGTTVLQPAAGPVTISDEWPLILFNVVVSLEWQPPDTTYSDDLRLAFRLASDYLYDLTEGQMAFGPLTIYSGGQNWEAADFQIRAGNDVRPTAKLGGIVLTSTLYTTTNNIPLIYTPGTIMLGRYWNGQEASAGNWSAEAGYKTLVHEWGHYALFLYDDYEQATGTFCTCADLPNVGKPDFPNACQGISPDLAASAMAFHYTASELWLAESGDGSAALCQGVAQWKVYQESDWETLGRWGEIQGLPVEWLRVPTDIMPGPTLPQSLFGLPIRHQIYLPFVARNAPSALTSRQAAQQRTRTTDLTLTLLSSTALTEAHLKASFPQVYVGEVITSTVPGRIIYQGSTTGTHMLPDRSRARPATTDLGEITLLGLRPEDQLYVLVDRYSLQGTTGGRWVYFPTNDLPLEAQPVVEVITASWQASLDIDYALTGARLTTMTVTAWSTHTEPLDSPPLAQLCVPTSGVGCPDNSAWRQVMQAEGLGSWTATFTAPTGGELPEYGLLRIQTAGEGELIRWFQDGGGIGPAQIRGEAPRRDGMLMVDIISPTQAISGPNRVMLMPAANYEALTTPLPPDIEGVIGVPLDVDIIFAQPLLEPDISLTFFQGDERPADTLPLADISFRVLRFEPGLGWTEIAQAQSNSDVPWPTTQGTSPGGIYLVGWSYTEPFKRNPKP